MSVRNNLRYFIGVVAFISLVCFADLFGQADNLWWKIEVVDSIRGQYTSIVLDSNYYPWISYYDRDNGWLRCAHWTGTSWDIDTVDGGNVGMYSNIALDTSGYPHIVYFDDVNTRLKHAWWTGTVWDTETVKDPNSGDYGYWCDIAIDSLNRIWVSYHDRDNGRLMCARKVGAEWDTIYIVDVPLGTNQAGEYSSICIDTANYPHISYYHQTTGLKHAFWNGSIWQTGQVDNIGYYTSITASEWDTLYISYYDNSSQDLKYAKGYDSLGNWKWTTDAIDTGGDVGKWTSIALYGNSPHISYYDSTSSRLKYAHLEAGTWEIEVVDSPNVGEYTSIALDTNGLPCISYYDSNNGWLKCARLLIRPQVDSTSPIHNEVNVSQVSEINVWFSKDIESATINGASFKVIGSQSGEKSGTITYNGVERKATFTLNPNEYFYIGEKVTVTLTDSIKSTEGAPLVPYTFEFTIEALDGIAEFRAGISYNVLGTSLDMEVADLDLDGDPDIVTLSRDTIMVWRNDVDSLLAVDTIISPTSLACIAILDLDLDGLPDIVVDTGTAAPYGIKFYRNQGGLNFAWGFWRQTASQVTDMFVSDFDGDGDLDIAALEFTQVEILLNEGFFNFTSSDTIDLTFSHNKLYGADYNNDGLIDLVSTVEAGPSGYHVLANLGDGKFDTLGVVNLSQNVYDIISSDFNNDYNADNALTGDDTLIISSGNGDFSFAPEDDYVATGATYLTSGDFDADGDIDLAVTGVVGSGDDTLLVFLNENANFDSVRKSYVPMIDEIVSADFNLDSTIDLAIIHGGLLTIFYNTPDTLPPEPPQNLTANGGSPSPWTKDTLYKIDWLNPSDPSGIAFANYKLGTRPQSDWDTLGTMDAEGSPKDSVFWYSEGKETLWVWLVDGRGNTSKDSVSWVLLRRDTTPPTEPIKILPAHKSWINTTTVDFHWHHSTDNFSILNYGICVDDEMPTSPPYLGLWNGYDTTYTFTNLPEDTIYWRIWAKDSAWNYSTQSYWWFKIDTTKPDSTRLISPDDNVWTNGTPTFVWHKTYDNFVIRDYRLRVDTVFPITPTPIIDQVLQDTFFEIIVPLREDKYYWQVGARDSALNAGPLSRVRAFKVDTTILAPISLTANGSSPSLWTSDSLFVIDWQNPIDSSGIKFALYKLGVRPQSDWDTLGVDDVGGVMSALGLPKDTIYWTGEGKETLWVWLCDSVDNINYHNAAWVILRRDTTPPVTPVLSEPDSGVWRASLQFTFIWYKVVDNLAGTEIYFVQLDTTLLFNSSELKLDSTYDTAWTYTLPYEAKWYWRVYSRDSAGNFGDTSNIWWVGADTTPPNPFQLISPVDSAWAQGKPTFVWHSTQDGLSGLLSYNILVDTTESFASPVIDTWINETTYTAIEQLAERRHWWYVGAYDYAYNARFTSVYTLKVDTTVEAPINLTANGSSPSPWTKNDTFVIDWQNPPDSTGIKFALYKLGTRPSSAWDTSGEGIMHLPPDTIVWQGEGKETLWVWLCDSVDNIGYHNTAWVILRRDTTPPVNPLLIMPDSSTYQDSIVVQFVWHTTQDLLSGVWYYYLYVDSGQAVLETALVDTSYLDTFSEEVYWWTVIAVDSANNADTLNYHGWWFGVDTTAPAPPESLLANWETPSPWTQNDTFVIWWKDTSYNIAPIVRGLYKLGSQPDSNFDTTGTIDSLPWPVIWQGEGIETLWVWEQDQAGNLDYRNCSYVLLRRDTTPPDSVVLISPVDSAFLNTLQPEFVWHKASDALSGIRGYYFWDTAYATGKDTAFFVEETSFVVSCTLDESWHLWLIVSVDSAWNNSAGSTHYPTSIHYLCLDTTPPESTLASSRLYSTTDTFTVSWSGSVDDLSGLLGAFDVWVKDGTGTWTLWLDSVYITDTIFTGVEGHTYYFEALAYDKAGNIEKRTGIPECSTTVDTTPPNAPTLISPDSASWTNKINSLDFYWHSVNDSSGVDKYFIQISEDGFVTFLVDDSTNDTQYTAGTLVEGILEWRVWARDNVGNVGDTSVVWRVGIDTTPPDAPDSLTANGDTFKTKWTNDSMFIVDWKDISDASGVVFAWYKLGTRPTSNNDTVGRINHQDTIYCAKEYGETLWVWLQDIAGNSDYNNVNWVILRYDSTPPIDAVAEAPSIVNTMSFIVSWSRGQDVGAGVKEWILAYRYSGNPWDSITGLTDTFCNFNAPVEGVIYAFQAVAIDSAGNTEEFIATLYEDTTWVDTTNPGQPVLVSPIDSEWLNTTDTVLIWHEVDDFTKIKWYYVEVDTDTTFSNPIFDDSTQDTSYGITSLTEKTYYWRIRARDNAENLGNWSKIEAFQIDTTPPAKPLLISPVSDSLVNQVYLVWHRPDDNFSGAAKFEVQVDTINTFANPETIEIVTDTFVNLGKSFKQGRHYWRVKAFDFAGNEGDWSAIDSFKLDITAPQISSTSPVDGATGVPTDQKIQVIFTEYIDTLTVNDTTVKVTSGTQGPLSIVKISWVDPSWCIIDVGELPANDVITCKLYASIKDRAGNLLDGNANGIQEGSPDDDYTFSFSTGASADNYPPEIVDKSITYEGVEIDTTWGLDTVILWVKASDYNVNAYTYIDTILYYIDELTTSYGMSPVDGKFDSLVEEGVDTITGISTWQEGLHTIYIKARDKIGNWSTIDSIKIFVNPEDTVPPEFAIELSDTIVDTSILVQIIPNEPVNPDSVIICSFKVGSYIVDTAIPPNVSNLMDTLAIYFDTRQMPMGNCILKVAGYDRGLRGLIAIPNRGESDTSFVIADLIPPEIDTATLTPGIIYQNDTMILFVRAHDSRGVRLLKYAIDSTTNPAVKSLPTDTLVECWDTLIAPQDTGYHTLYTWVVDTGGNNSSAKLLLFKVSPLDEEPPIFNWQLAPVYYIGDTVEITIKAIEKERVKICTTKCTQDTLERLFVWADTIYTISFFAFGWDSGEVFVHTVGYDLRNNKGESDTCFLLIPRPGNLLDPQQTFCWPNPVVGNRKVYFHFKTTRNAHIRVEIYNLEGRLIKVIEKDVEGGIQSHLLPKTERVALDTRGFRSGAYYVRIVATTPDGKSKAVLKRKLVIIK